MAKNKIRIRDGLHPNQETRPSNMARLYRERYGFYRPLGESSINGLVQVLESAKVEIDEYLTKAKPEDDINLELYQDFGVTFVKQRRVGRQLFQAISGGFTMGRAIERLENKGGVSDRCLDVPIDPEKFGWSPVRPYRKAIARFATSKALDELFEEKEIIDGVLSEFGFKGVVDNPDHLTLYKYGNPGEGSNLNRIQKRRVAKIIGEHFVAQKFEVVTLKPLNVGPSYNEACPQWESVTSGI